MVKSGFLMMQESVYVKLTQNSSAAQSIVDNIRKNIPSEGLVQAIRVTEKQYTGMDFLLGEHSKEVLDTSDKLVVL